MTKISAPETSSRSAFGLQPNSFLARFAKHRADGRGPVCPAWCVRTIDRDRNRRGLWDGALGKQGRVESSLVQNSSFCCSPFSELWLSISGSLTAEEVPYRITGKERYCFQEHVSQSHSQLESLELSGLRGGDVVLVTHFNIISDTSWMCTCAQMLVPSPA